jgi:hypothetical protein
MKDDTRKENGFSLIFVIYPTVLVIHWFTLTFITSSFQLGKQHTQFDNDTLIMLEILYLSISASEG